MILTITTFLPLFGALLLLLVPKEEEGILRGFAFAISLATFGASLFLLGGDFVPSQWNYVVDKPWVPTFGVHFKLGVDGISLWLVLLTTFIMPIATYVSFGSVTQRTKDWCFEIGRAHV